MKTNQNNLFLQHFINGKVSGSFIADISVAPLQSSSSLLPRGAPDTVQILCRRFTPKRHRQLRVKDLFKVSTWRPERDLNPRPFERKTTNLQMSLHTPLLSRSIPVPTIISSIIGSPPLPPLSTRQHHLLLQTVRPLQP